MSRTRAMPNPTANIVAWQRPAKSGPSTPLLILLHGRGADERDLIDLGRVLPQQFAFASVRAPVQVEGGGFTWFENRGPARPIARSVRASVDAFRAWLDGPDVAAFAAERTYLLGFSAGMMMAGALVLDEPSRFAGAVLLSGALAFDTPIPVTPGRLSGVPIFYGFGTLDDVIPTELAARTETYLREKSGADLTLRSYPHAHSISHREVLDVRAWLDALPRPSA